MERTTSLVEKQGRKMVSPTITKAGAKKSMREYSRVEVCWPVMLHTAEGLIDGELRNASVEGALIHCQRLADLSEVLEVSIEIPGSAFPVTATVEIVRSGTHDSHSASSSGELAVRFIEMSEEGRRIFCTAVEHQARTRELRPATKPDASRVLSVELLKVVERLTAELDRSLDDLLEEAVEDLVKKYENKPMTSRSRSERDQRQNPRVEVSWPVVVKTSNKSIRGEVKNISSIGALVCCHELPGLDLGQTFQLQMKIPEHNYIFTIPANLVRFDISNSESSFFRYSLAFRFVEISENDLIFLSNTALRELK
jgi:hypothetical protein